MAAKKKKVHIFGGGVGGMTAAYYLSSTPELRDAVEVHVYQIGWRLGGKCAAGRNADAYNRIEEHGIHMLMGWYANAFSTFRDCWASWPDRPGQDLYPHPQDAWKIAFIPQYEVSVVDELQIGSATISSPWTIHFPKLPGEPGDTDEASFRADLKKMARIGVETLTGSRHTLKAAGVRGTVGIVAKLSALAATGGGPDAQGTARGISSWIEGEVDKLLQRQGLATDIVMDAYRVLLILNFGTAILRGILSDVILWGLLHPGQDPIAELDKKEWKAWLKEHGLIDAFSWSSAVRSLYDLAFAFPGGVRSEQNASLAAGSSLMTTLRTGLRYKDAPLWGMDFGTGDTLFTPMYEVAKSRGVVFHFFHELTDLGVGTNGAGELTLTSFTVNEQVALKGRKKHYDPLVPVQGLVEGAPYPSWPSTPQWSQLKDPDPTRNYEMPGGPAVKTRTVDLTDGEDFVILGTSIAGIPAFGSELIRNSDTWRLALENSATVGTLATQLWLTQDLVELGWEKGTTTLTTYDTPFASWGDYTRLNQRADWPDGQAPQTIAYFCGVYPDGGLDDDAVAAAFQRWYAQQIGLLWPNTPADIDQAPLYPFPSADGPSPSAAAAAAQYYRANVEIPAERYVLSLPGTIQYRLDPVDCDVDNLFLAGDWVATQINGGSVEAAVEAGMWASQGVCQAIQQSDPSFPIVPASIAQL